MRVKEILKKIWHFLWHEDSVASWLVNLVLAFVLVKFIIYPGIGLVFGTQYPIVAVVSSSMEHGIRNFDTWYEKNSWYAEHGISKEQFSEFPFSNGFNKGDIMILTGVEASRVKIGDVVVYQSSYVSNPIIHRVVNIREENGKYYYQTKGDNNPLADSIDVNEGMIRDTGKAVVRIPYLGWVKIAFVSIFGDIL